MCVLAKGIEEWVMQALALVMISKSTKSTVSKTEGGLYMVVLICQSNETMQY